MSYSFTTRPGTPAVSNVSVPYDLSNNTLSVQVSKESDFQNVTQVGTVTYANGKITLSLTGAQVDSIGNSYYRIKATRPDTTFFYVLQGTIDYVQNTSSVQSQITELKAAVDALDGGGLAPFTSVLQASGGDDTAMLDAALEAGSVLLTPSGGPFHVGRVTYKGSASRRIFALEPVQIVQTDALGVFDLEGGWDNLGTVSSYAITPTNLVPSGESAPVSSNSSVTVLTLAAPVTVAVGDVVKIVSDDQVPTGRNANYRMGEYAVVAKASTASTTVTLSNVLIESYATNVRLGRVQKVSFSIEGPITFDTDPTIRNATTGESVVRLRSAQNCYIGGGVAFDNTVGRAIGNFTYGAEIQGVKFRNLANRPSVNQWGYGIQDGGWMTRVVGCTAENARHLYSEGTYEVTAGAAQFEFFGGGWFAHVSDCMSFGCSAQGFDTHGTAYGTVFSNCHAVGGFVGASSGGGGFVARGRRITFTNCFVDNSFRGFVVSAAGTSLYNCVVRRARYSALEVIGDTSDAITVTNIPGIYIAGSSFETTDGGYFTVSLGQTGYTIGVEIERSRFRKSGAPGNGARMFELVAGASLKFADLIVDWEPYVGVHSLSAFYLTDATASIFGKRLTHFGGSAAVPSFTGFQPSGAGAYAAPIEVYDIEHRHTSLDMLVFNANFTNKKSSYRKFYGAAWFNRITSTDLTIAAATNAVLPVGDKLDQVIVVRLTGTAGAVTLANLPTTALVTGQIVHVLNNSNGDVTLNSVVITATTGRASFVFSQGVWRQLA